MAKPNYNFEKRQRDLAKKKQQDEKRQKKLAKKGESNPGEAGGDAEVDPALPDGAADQGPEGN